MHMTIDLFLSYFSLRVIDDLNDYSQKTSSVCIRATKSAKAKAPGAITKRPVQCGSSRELPKTPLSTSSSADDIEDPPEIFWKTLVVDRGKDGRNSPYCYSRECKELAKKGGYASGVLSTSDLINNKRNSIVAHFDRRAQAVVWNW